MAARVDVDATIRPHLNEANRKFQAAMDELVPPDADELAKRAAPLAVGLAQLVHAWKKAMTDFGTAYAATLRQLQQGDRR